MPIEEIRVSLGPQIEGRVANSLIREHIFGETIESHDAIVVGRTERCEELVRDGKERQVLDIGVVFRRVRDDCRNRSLV